MRDGVGWPETLCRGDWYENRFLCGVEGVSDGAGSAEVVRATGGVCERPEFRMLALSVGERL